MALGSTQSLIEMSTRIFPGGKKRPVSEADILTTILGHCHEILEPQLLEPSGHLSPVMGDFQEDVSA